MCLRAVASAATRKQRQNEFDTNLRDQVAGRTEKAFFMPGSMVVNRLLRRIVRCAGMTDCL